MTGTAETPGTVTDITGRALLRRADFRRWYLSRSVSHAGTIASAVALPLLAYRSSGSATVTAAVVGLEAVPYLLFGLVAGAVADRWPRRRLMVGADLVAAVLVTSVPVAAAAGRLTAAHILAVAFGIGTAFCWFDAAAWGALARVAGRPGLPAANGLIWSTATVLGIAVPALVGLALTVADPSTVLLVDAGSYLVSAALLRRLRTGLDADRPGGPASLRAEITAGLAYLWRQPVIRTLSLAGFSLSISGGGTLGLLVVYADRHLSISASDPRLGVLYTAAALGALAAASLLTRMTRHVGAGPLSVGAYLAFTLALCSLAAVTAYPAALIIWAGWNFASTTAIVNGITIRQQLTPDELQGRVNTTARMIAWGGTPFGAVLGGLVADTAGVTTAYLVLAAPIATGLGVLLLSPVSRLRTIDDPAETAPPDPR